MWLLFVEAMIALGLLIFIVWWTMFSGQKKNAPPKKLAPPKEEKAE